MDGHGSDRDPHTVQPDHTLKPLIKELVRTQVCFPNLKLLVDKVTIVILREHENAAGNEAYRLFLTDGEKTIQALLKRRIHKTMISFGIYEGSYVVLKKYHLAKAKKLAGGVVIYVVIDDFHSVGEDERENPRIEYYYQYLSSSRDGASRFAIRRGEIHSPSFDLREDGIQSQNAQNTTVDCDFDEEESLEDISLIPMPSSVTSTPKKRRRETPLEENPNVASRWNSAAKLAQELEGPGDKHSISPSSQRSSCQSESLPATPSKRRRTSLRQRPSSSDDGSVRNQIKDEKSTAVIHTAGSRPTAPFTRQYQTSFSQEHTPDEPAAENPSKTSNTPTRAIHPPSYHPTQLAPSPLPRLPHPLVPLSHISLHRRRNTTYSILCLVHSVTPVLPSPLGPKRDLRIVDPSTTKKVLLSIFMEPERFWVEPGKAVLFRGVTTHEWEGGMVSVYPKMCRGLGVWYVVEPEGWDLGLLSAWWNEKYKNGAVQEGKG